VLLDSNPYLPSLEVTELVIWPQDVMEEVSSWAKFAICEITCFASKQHATSKQQNGKSASHISSFFSLGRSQGEGQGEETDEQGHGIRSVQW